ncbi:abortive infection system antitoxin AbiGi family protein [Chryseobacterium luquanense]|uniref:Abortive infection system antitoxin AbiGi family protein n=1 Tax=Chryseobacterium luquanense TaxID=2983766 RepID=A0ABT3Y3F1_9FLAO|nr:abortive infection system antitoxin AbiGi family protein [Chryseobacterium luquanense]MCX8532679.1 abortive infection system antitoxin AbiGi family protein [Chryseobacterium luquanense]
MGFEQKKINHIFHYTKKISLLKSVLKNGFAPSYCIEKVGDNNYYIPMVSFCNISIKDVELYARYGDYGIGMSLDWAIKNAISPVVYTHENTKFRNIHNNINNIQIWNLIEQMLPNIIEAKLNGNNDNTDYSQYEKIIQEVNRITVPAIQHFKNWKVQYKEKEIITYLEREWRYIPNLPEDVSNIIHENENEFQLLKNNEFRKKPHFPELALQINEISDLRYIMIKNESQRTSIINILYKKYGKEKVIDSILNGRLLIFSAKNIKNDF